MIENFIKKVGMLSYTSLNCVLTFFLLFTIFIGLNSKDISKKINFLLILNLFWF